MRQKPGQQISTAKEILEFINQFLSHQEECKGKNLGKPINQYKKEYREVNDLGKDGTGSLTLVERRADHKYFVAK